VKGADNLTGTIDIGLTKVCTAVRALSIEDMECIANPKYCQSLLPSSHFFDFAFGKRLEDFFLAAAKLEGVHGELRWLFSKN
jgi:hypothetical protein